MTEKKKVAYIAGPMRGRPNYNYDYFNQVEAKLKEQGWRVLNPTHNFNGDQSRPFSEYMQKDVGDLLKADAVFLLPGWQDSEGARIEYSVAKATGKEIVLVDAASGQEPPEMTASRLVRSGEREAAYGHPGADFARTAKIWSAIFGVDVTPQQVALAMAGLKLSRLVGNPGHEDSLVDLIGYGICLDRVNGVEWRSQ